MLGACGGISGSGTSGLYGSRMLAQAAIKDGRVLVDGVAIKSA
jgi:ribosomal 50S subunit-recycling heat shock protein